MKKRYLLFIILILAFTLSACAQPAPVAAEAVATPTPTVAPTPEAPTVKIITDMAGRTHEVPAVIDSVFCTNPVGTTLIYTLAPQTLVGWNYQFNDHELAYIAPEYRDLPVFGTIKTANYEALLATEPDIIISAAGVDEKTAVKIDEFQAQLGVPIIMVDESLEKTAEVYAFLGELLGVSEQAAILGAYAEDVLTQVASTEIAEAEQVTVYYGNGINSLDTSAKGTPPSQVFDILGAVNVCDLETETPDRIEINAEYLIEWNPDYIFVNGEPSENVTGTAAKNDLMGNPAFASLTAVQNDHIINIPKAPFAWIDRPRSANRLLGLKWLGSILYPEKYSFSDSDVIAFYQMFYHIDLTADDITSLMEK